MQVFSQFSALPSYGAGISFQLEPVFNRPASAGFPVLTGTQLNRGKLDDWGNLFLEAGETGMGSQFISSFSQFLPFPHL
jgi:hypothetical protein